MSSNILLKFARFTIVPNDDDSEYKKPLSRQNTVSIPPLPNLDGPYQTPVFPEEPLDHNPRAVPMDWWQTHAAGGKVSTSCLLDRYCSTTFAALKGYSIAEQHAVARDATLIMMSCIGQLVRYGLSDHAQLMIRDNNFTCLTHACSVLDELVPLHKTNFSTKQRSFSVTTEDQSTLLLLHNENLTTIQLLNNMAEATSTFAVLLAHLSTLIYRYKGLLETTLPTGGFYELRSHMLQHPTTSMRSICARLYEHLDTITSVTATSNTPERSRSTTPTPHLPSTYFPTPEEWV